MTFDKIHKRIWAVRCEGEEDNELARLFDLWSNVSYLRAYFKKYELKVRSYWKTTINDAVTRTLNDATNLEDKLFFLADNADLKSLFEPLEYADIYVYDLQRNKAKNTTRANHNGWLRIYALRLDNNSYLITGGAIKLAQRMEHTDETRRELEKLNQCRAFLRSEQITDPIALDDFIAEN